MIRTFIRTSTITNQKSHVELVGVEPTTPCLQSRCSSQLSYSPFFSKALPLLAIRRLAD